MEAVVELLLWVRILPFQGSQNGPVGWIRSVPFLFEVDADFAAAMATLVWAPPKDFLVVRQEWAAIHGLLVSGFLFF
ncbi:hypothetical protein SLEP1_g24739 [Rubroshorea leprosula]|uniref:Uncharacterized protein n=1 Tax=Rubroshorea leprosula TaxID=152421 RepID=A0AAV5JMU0_9ROSI|nr:hypothetical protein SLEP1_g24739 [Rubroshorea leprosula]